MFTYSIKFTAKKEFRKYVVDFIDWQEMPFIKKQLKDARIKQEQILNKEKDVHKIFGRIQSLQAEYTSTLNDDTITKERLQKEIETKKDEIDKIASHCSFLNNQIDAFNNGEAIQCEMNIFQLRAQAENVSKKLSALIGESQNLEETKKEKAESTKNKLSFIRKEIIMEYSNFKTEVKKVSEKMNSRIIKRKKYAITYSEFIWDLFVRKFNKEKAKNKNNSQVLSDLNFYFSQQHKFDTSDFVISVPLFEEEKKAIEKFNNAYNIDFTI